MSHGGLRLCGPEIECKLKGVPTILQQMMGGHTLPLKIGLKSSFFGMQAYFCIYIGRFKVQTFFTPLSPPILGGGCFPLK